MLFRIDKRMLRDMTHAVSKQVREQLPDSAVKHGQIYQAVASGLGYRHQGVLNATLRTSTAICSIDRDEFSARLQALTDVEVNGDLFATAATNTLNEYRKRGPRRHSAAKVVAGYRARHGVVTLRNESATLVIGAKGSGKTSCVVIPTLLSTECGLFVDDPTGEVIAAGVPEARAEKGDEVYVLGAPDTRFAATIDPLSILPKQLMKGALPAYNEMIVEILPHKGSASVAEQASSPNRFSVDMGRQLLLLLMLGERRGQLDAFGAGFAAIRDSLAYCLENGVDDLRERLSATLNFKCFHAAEEPVQVLMSPFVDMPEQTLAWIVGTVKHGLDVLLNDPRAAQALSGKGRQVDFERFARGEAAVFVSPGPENENPLPATFSRLVAMSLGVAKRQFMTGGLVMFSIWAERFPKSDWLNNAMIFGRGFSIRLLITAETTTQVANLHHSDDASASVILNSCKHILALRCDQETAAEIERSGKARNKRIGTERREISLDAISNGTFLRKSKSIDLQSTDEVVLISMSDRTLGGAALPDDVAIPLEKMHWSKFDRSVRPIA